MPVRISAESDGQERGDGDAAVTSRLEITLPGARCVCVVGPVDRQALGNVLAVLIDQGWGKQDVLPEGMNGVRSRGKQSC